MEPTPPVHIGPEGPPFRVTLSRKIIYGAVSTVASIIFFGSIAWLNAQDNKLGAVERNVSRIKEIQDLAAEKANGKENVHDVQLQEIHRRLDDIDRKIGAVDTKLDRALNKQ